MPIPRFALLAALSLTLTAPLVPALAQAPSPPMHGGGMHGGRMRNMGDELGLTAAQKAQMQPILMSAGRQFRAIQANTALTPQARMVKMQALQHTISAQMMALLTPAQRTKLKAMRLAQHQGRPGGPM